MAPSRAIIAALGLTLGSVAAAPGGTPEYAVKAAFVYNFVKFVEWPQGDPLKALTVCICGKSPIEGFLDEAVRGKLVHGLPIEGQRKPENTQNWDSCQVVFFGATSRASSQSILSQLKGRSVLTIGDSGGFAADGGMIGLVMEDDRARFEINLEAAAETRLKVSSKLAELGHVVRSRK